MVTGLPPTGSWQDLKDHMREAGDVCYSDVFKDGSGVVEYLRREDMKYALKKLDDTKFKSHEVNDKEFKLLNLMFINFRAKHLISVSRKMMGEEDQGDQDPRQDQDQDRTESPEDPQHTRQSGKIEAEVETEARAEVEADLDLKKVANQDPAREGSQDPGQGRDPARDPKDEGYHLH